MTEVVYHGDLPCNLKHCERCKSHFVSANIEDKICWQCLKWEPYMKIQYLLEHPEILEKI